jgi:hypothetical protein
MSTKALTQTIFPGDFRMALPFLERRFCFFTVYKVHKKHHILKPSIVTPFV